MTTKFTRSRRTFLKQSAALGGGLSIGFHIPGALAAEAGIEVKGTEVNPWVIVRPDDTVIIRYARSEMGQGSFTSAPMLVAEELECDWKKVRVEYASPNEHIRRKRIWGNMNSVGSFTIRTSQDYLRRGGATAREMLIAAAAQKWDVPPNERMASKGIIIHKLSGRKTSFGKVASDAARMEPPAAGLPVRHPRRDAALRRARVPRSVVPGVAGAGAADRGARGQTLKCRRAGFIQEAVPETVEHRE